MSYPRTSAHCSRKGCKRKTYRDKDTCSIGCTLLVAEAADAFRLHEALGSNDLTEGFLSAVDALTAAWEEIQDSRRAIWKAATEQGWQPHEISGLFKGTVGVRRTDQEPVG